MKFFILTFFCVTLSSTVMAANEINHVINKIDQRLNQAEELQNNTNFLAVNGMERNEAKLWTSIVGAYDLLKQFSVGERYFFMYQAMQANTLAGPEKIKSLETWLKKENAKILAENLYPGFYVKWKIHVANITAALNELSKPVTKTDSTEAAAAMRRLNNAFLNELKSDLKEIKIPAPVVVKATPEVAPKAIEPSETSPSNLVEMFAASLICLAVGLFFGRNKEVKTVKKTKTKQKVAQEVEVKETVAAVATTVTHHPGVNLEQACNDTLENNLHLLEIANLTVHPTNRSPFKSTVHAPSEKVLEALNWLLKGTIAVANTQSNKVSSMEWTCRETAGRVSLEFTLHGIECNYKSLYLNAMVEGESSAPAHFGRSEMALEGHLPTVQFKSGMNRTIVSLGLDSLNSTNNH